VNSGLGAAFSIVKTTGETPVPQLYHGLLERTGLTQAGSDDIGTRRENEHNEVIIYDPRI